MSAASAAFGSLALSVRVLLGWDVARTVGTVKLWRCGAFSVTLPASVSAAVWLQRAFSFSTPFTLFFAAVSGARAPTRELTSVSVQCGFGGTTCVSLASLQPVAAGRLLASPLYVTT